MDADDAIARAEIARKYVREVIEQSKRLRDSVEGRQFPPVPWNRALNLPKRPKRSTRR